MTSLADIERSYVSAGRALYPLQSVDDAAALLRAAAAVPAHAPSRSRRIVDKLHAVGSALAGRASEMLLNIDSVLAGMQSRPSVERLVNELPPTNGIVLLTQREECAVSGCDGELRLAHHATNVQADHPTVYTTSGVVRAELILKRCSRCRAIHYLSYAAGGDLLDEKAIQTYPGCISARYIQFTPSTIWETKLLDNYGYNLLHAHVSARSFSRIYASSQHITLPSSWRQRLHHAWYAREFLRRLSDAGIPLPAAPLSSIEGVDVTVERYFDQLTAIFVRTWGNGHTSCCRSPSTCKNELGGIE